MKMSLHFSSMLILIIFLSSCSLITDNGNLEITGLTETDKNGFFSGNIDKNDWSPSSYKNVYFDNDFWIYPSTSLTFYIDSSNQPYSKEIRFYNSGSRKKIFSFSTVLPPFSIDTSKIQINPRSLFIKNVNFVTPDSLWYIFDRDLIISNEKKEITLQLKSYNSEYIHHYKIPPQNPIFYPAFPNPARKIVNFKYCLIIPTKIKLFIKDKNNDIISTLVNETQSSGTHIIQWNCQDIENGFYRAFIEIGNIEYFGDIKIEK